MDLRLTEHVRNTISLLYKQKTRWNSDISYWFSEKINFGLYISLKIDISSQPRFITSLWRHTLTDFHDSGYQWKEETLPYTMVPNNYTLGMSISNSQGVVTTPQENMLQKRLRKTRVNPRLCFFKAVNKGVWYIPLLVNLKTEPPICLIDGSSHTKISTNIQCMTSQWRHKG